jgi:branched-chain amino acid aminotransferase
MGRVAMIDGVLLPLESATVSVLDRGFLYGDSVFETIRTYGGEPFALGEHLGRLERSAALVHIALPVAREVLADEVRTALCAASNEESYVRVTITRGSGQLGLDPALAGEALRVVVVTELRAPPEVAYERGIVAATFAARRVADGTAAAGSKIGNYLVSILAMRAASAVGAAEALIVDGEGRVVEGATSNVFFVRDGEVTTPPEDAGILAGITRGRVLEVARELEIPVRLRAPLAGELPAFDEVWISSSIRELLPVVRIDDHVVGAGAPGPVYQRVLAAFRGKVRSARPVLPG